MRTEIHVYGGKKIFLDFDENDPIRHRSPVSINDRIEEKIANQIRVFSRKDSEDITERINQLDQEWDLDRTLVALLSGGASIFSLLGATKRQKWAYFPSILLSILTLHSFKRWSFIGLLLRRFNIRSKDEISSEKYALKTLRGDYLSRIA